jgi:hypothetical protein
MKRTKSVSRELSVRRLAARRDEIRAEISFVWCACIVGCLLICGNPARADDDFWQAAGGHDGGSWNDGTHWTLGHPPAGGVNGDVADIAYTPGAAYSIDMPSDESFKFMDLDSPNATITATGVQITTVADSDLKRGAVILSGSSWVPNGGATTSTITIESPVTFTTGSAGLVGSSFSNNVINNGTFNENGSLQQLSAGPGTTFTNNSSFNVSSGAVTAIVSNSFTQAGGTLVISSAPGTAFKVTSGGTFNFNGGSVSGTVQQIGGTLAIGPGAGSGTFDCQFSTALKGSILTGQTIIIDSNDTNLVSTLTWSTGFSNNGEISLTSAGTSARNAMLSLPTGKTLTNNGVINAEAGVGGTRYFNVGAFSNSITGTVNINTGSELDPSVGGSVGPSLSNAGHLNIAAGKKLQIAAFGSYTQTSGVTRVDGTLAMTTALATIQIEGGTLQGSGTVSNNVTSSGTVAPGDSAGVLTISAQYTQSSTGKLEIELGGTTAGTQYDQLHVSGAVALDGKLQVDLISGFAPVAGDSFDILDWGSLSGNFAMLSLPVLGGGLNWNVSQLYTTGVLKVSGVAGDYNHNGVVDAADYTVWRDSLGQSGGGLAADGNGNGTVDAGDYTVWLTNFGNHAGSGAGVSAIAAVPEPSVTMLLFPAIVASCVWLRRPTGRR